MENHTRRHRGNHHHACHDACCDVRHSDTGARHRSFGSLVAS